jgi:hypothetical protein
MTAEIDVQACVRAVREDGYCVLTGLLPRDAVEAVRQAFVPILSAFVAENADKPNRGSHRHYIPLPFRPPFYHSAFFNNEPVLDIVRSILGEGMAIDQFASDTPLKGSIYQDIHSDLGPLFPEQPDLVLPPMLLATNFSFINVTPSHGPFEIAPGTHRLPRTQAMADAKAGNLQLKQLMLQVGDLLIRDVRCLHRGTPNVTDEPRGVAVISYVRDSFRREHHQYENSMPAATWNLLSDRERALLRVIPRTV